MKPSQPDDDDDDDGVLLKSSFLEDSEARCQNARNATQPDAAQNLCYVHTCMFMYFT